MASRDAVGRAVYETAVDPSGLKKGLSDADRAIKATGTQMETAFARQGTGALGKLGASVDGIVGKFNRIAQGGGVGGALLGGVGLGAGLSAYNLVSNVVTGTIEKIGQSLTLASDKAEAASKANVLFGASYGIIEKASKTAATAVGLSSGAYLEAAGNLGNLITNFGITGDAGAEMSRSMVQLAADMGSFNNASTEEVTQAMGSAFVGETEPLRRFGVMLSAAAVSAKAVELGLAKSAKEVSQSAKVQATYALILEQTTKAQGDFARTADGKANADRIRAAQYEEALTKLGEVITPLYQKAMPLLAAATTAVIDVLVNLGTFIAPLVDGALTTISNAIALIGDSVTGLRNLLDSSGAEWDAYTAEIMKQSEALGISGDAALAWIEAEKKRKKALADQLVIEKQIYDNERRSMDLNLELMSQEKTLKDDIEETIKVKGKDADVSFQQAELDRIRARRLTELTPLLTEHDLLTGNLAEARRKATEASAEDNKVVGQATEDLAAYNLQLQNAKDRQDALSVSIGANRVIWTQAEAAVNDFATTFDRLARENPGGAAWTRFLTDNADLIRMHFDELPDHIQQALRAAGLEVDKGAGFITQFADFVMVGLDGLFDGVAPAVDAAVVSAADQFSELGPTIRERSAAVRADVRAVMRAIRLDIVSPFRDIDDAMFIETQLASKAIRRGLKSSDPEIRADTQKRVRFLEQQQDELLDETRLKSLLTSKAMERGLASEDPEIRKKWRARRAFARARLIELRDETKQIATDSVVKYGSGLDAPSALAAVRTSIARVTAIIKDYLKLGSPAKEGPLSVAGGPQGWAQQMVEKMATGARAGLPAFSAAMGDVAAAAAFASPMGSMTPALSGWSATSAPLQTVTHEHRGRVQVELSGSTIAAAREQGASWDDVGRMAAAANLGDVLRDAGRQSHFDYSSPRR
jgi:hypothetical protein